MDLAAKKKKNKSVSPPAETAKAVASMPSSTIETYSHSITVRYSTLLYTTLQNMISAAHMANDFTYTSVTDVVRAALQAYMDGMDLTEPNEPGEKRQTSIRVTTEMHQFYKTWPNQMRTKILERVIRSFLKQV